MLLLYEALIDHSRWPLGTGNTLMPSILFVLYIYLIGLSLSKDLYLVTTQKLIFPDFTEIRRISCEIWQISWNPAHFMRSTWKPYKSNNSRKTLQFHGVQWEGYVSGFHMQFAGFHKIHQISCEIPPHFMKSATNTYNCQEW